MIKQATRTIVSAGLAGILALGACACSSSSSTTTEVTTESTTEDGTTTKSTETTTTTSDNGSSTTTTETSTSNVVDVQSWTEAWKGESEKGQTVFFAQSTTTPAQALLAIYDPKTSTLVSHDIGSITKDENGMLTITDAGNTGQGYKFAVVSEQDDGTTVVELGDEYGKATLKRVDMASLISDLTAADPNGEFMS